MSHLNNKKFAELAGVSRQAVGPAIKAGIIHKTKDGIDPDHHVNRQYIATPKKQNQNHALRKATAGLNRTTKINGIIATIEPPPQIISEPLQDFGEMANQAAGQSLEKIKLENIKLRQQIKKLELENAVKEDFYIQREKMLSLMNRSYKVIVSYFHPLGNQLSDIMDSIYGNSDKAKTTKCITAIEDAVTLGLDAFKDSLEKE